MYRTIQLPPRRIGANPLPYDMKPANVRITSLGWSVLTEAEARTIIENARRRRRRLGTLVNIAEEDS